MAKKKQTKKKVNKKTQPKKDYSWIDNEAFDRKLEELVDDMSTPDILQVPGVHEAMSEYLNNEVIEALEEERG